MIKLGKIYHILVIIGLAVALVAIKMLTTEKSHTGNKESSDNLIQIASTAFEGTLCDSCEWSGSKLTCSPELLGKIMQNVDTAALNSVSDRSVTFKKEKGYVEVPAILMANMIDLNLFIQPVEQTKKE